MLRVADLRRLSRGLRFRLTASYALFFTVLLIGVSFLVHYQLRKTIQAEERSALADSWNSMKGYLRIEKNEDKLFTFLHYDGVPWNNNNAEHAVRAFTRLRNVIGTSTPKGHRDYATLLSIQQTLHYRGRGFLDFLRSGRMEIA